MKLWIWCVIVQTCGAATAAAEAKPSVIRIGFPGVGVGNRPVSSNTALATAQLRGFYEEEFKADGIQIRWSFLRGAGPAVNELYANGLLDFAHLGDLPSVIGRSSGLRYRLLAASSVRNNIYVSVPADSNIQSVRDLRGKRIAVTKGTATHLAGVKILERFGLKEQDVKLINMEQNPAQLALVTRDIDAALGGSDYLRLRDQGATRLIFTTRGEDPALTSNSSIMGSEDFIQKYPETTTRVLKVMLKAAKWLAETQPAQIFQLWTKSGSTFAAFREDWQGDDVKYRTSPLLDPYIAARYRYQITEAKRLKLLRDNVDFERWVEPTFLNRAIEELGLVGYWLPRGIDGKPAQSAKTAQASPQTGHDTTAL
jgi:sulfonate transport system substrate-binding protein